MKSYIENDKLIEENIMNCSRILYEISEIVIPNNTIL